MPSAHRPESLLAQTPARRAGAAGRSRSDGVLFLAISALALLVRIVFLVQVRDNPFFEGLVLDARRYDEWAQQIAAGDWFGRAEGVFFQAPLYPYLLAVIYATVGRSLWIVYLVQAVLGSLACGMLYLAGRALFSRAAGFAAGVIFALYAPAIWYDGLIQKANLTLFFVALLLCWLAQWNERPGAWRSGGIGAALGLLSLTWEQGRAWLPVVIVWLVVHFARYGRGAVLRWAMALAAGGAAVLLPVGLRNLAVGGEFALTTSQMGANFYVGNNPHAIGTYVPMIPGRQDNQIRVDSTELAERAQGRPLTPREVSAHWLDRALDYIRTQPRDWARLMALKWQLTWGAYEVPDADDFYYYQEWSPLLRTLGRVNHFGVLLPAAVVGVVVTWRERRRLWLLYALALTTSAVVTAFFVFGRYRYPIAPIAVLFAGAAIAAALDALRRVRGAPGVVDAAQRAPARAWIAGLVLAAAVAIPVNRWPALAADQRSLAISNHAGLLYRQGKFEEAAAEYRRSLELVEADVGGHFDLAGILLELKRPDEALPHLARAVEMEPHFAAGWQRWGVALWEAGQHDAAVEKLRRCVEIRPEDGSARSDLGFMLAETGRPAEAEVQLREAIRLAPQHEKAAGNLQRLLVRAARYAEAIDVLRAALERMPGSAALTEHYVRLRLACPDESLRDPAEAVRAAERLARSADPPELEHLDLLAAVQLEVGQRAAAAQTFRDALALAETRGETDAVAYFAERLREMGSKTRDVE